MNTLGIADALWQDLRFGLRLQPTSALRED
jgi:hypothetical protein